MGARKVIENTAYKLVVETDNGAYRLHFTRRYDTETTMTGKPRYVYRGWSVRGYRLAWCNWKSCDTSHIPASYKDEETARFLFHTISYHAWLVKVGKKVWAVCPRDAAKLEEAGCTLI